MLPNRWQRKANPSIFFIPKESHSGAPMRIEAPIPRTAAEPIVPVCSCDRSKVCRSEGMMSPRIENEKADATSEMQLATNKRRGFMRSVSEEEDAVGFSFGRRKVARLS